MEPKKKIAGRKRRELIEEEYGEPLLEVVRGFAAMGYSRWDTLAILGLCPTNAARFLRRLDPGNTIQWPRQNQSRRRRDNGEMIARSAAIARKRARALRERLAARGELIRIQGVDETLAHWAWYVGRHYGVSYDAIRMRVQNGWPPLHACTVRPSSSGGPLRYEPPPYVPAALELFNARNHPDRFFLQAFFRFVEPLPCPH